MQPWNTKLLLDRTHLKVLIEDQQGDLLKARLPINAQHPRALLTLLEGLALWAGAPVCAATCVPGQWDASLAVGLFGNALAPAESALVRFDFVETPTRRRRLRRLQGVGDFRQLYLLDQTGAR